MTGATLGGLKLQCITTATFASFTSLLQLANSTHNIISTVNSFLDNDFAATASQNQ